MTDKIFSFSATETGYNHIKAKPSKVCEDASGSYYDEQMQICVVADGHGSDNYPRTDRGSQFAVNVAIEQIKTFVQDIYNPDSENPEESEKESNELIEKLLYTKIDETHLLKYLSKNILMKWRELVERDVEENPFQETEMVKVSDRYRKRYIPEHVCERRAEKAYGCTLIAYVVTEKFSFGMQIGDGKCVVIDYDGTIKEPIPWDENCQMNVTTSICDSDASDEFRFVVTKEKPAAVFCGSDGIDDSYANVEEMYALYRSILKIFVEHGVEVGKSEIKEYLPVLTKRGSGDDVSIALIMDIQRVTELTPVFEAQTELFKLENQLKEKQHTAAVSEEKEKALTSKLSTMMRPGTRTPLDHQIYSQINELRFNMTQMDEEIFMLQSKVDNLKLRMPHIVAQCEPEMLEVDIDTETNVEEDVVEAPETVWAEYVEIATCAENEEEDSIVTEEVTDAECTAIMSEQTSTTREADIVETEDNKLEEVASEPQTTFTEPIEEMSQIVDQSVTKEKTVGDTEILTSETPEE